MKESKGSKSTVPLILATLYRG